MKRYEQLDENNKLIWNFRDIGQTLRDISEGKGGQKRILIILKETGPVTQRELTQRLGIQPGSASEVIGKLETAGLIRRSVSAADRRTANILLTEEGMKEAEEAKRRRDARHEQMFSCISDDEKKELLVLLEKINRAWDAQYRKGNR